MNTMHFIKGKFTNLQTPSLIILLLVGGCCWLAEEELDRKEPKATPEHTQEDYTLRDIEYFLDIALGAEYGVSESVKRWSGTVTYKIRGKPTSRDRMVTRSIMREITALTDSAITFKRVINEPEMVIWFVPVGDMSRYESNYIEGNWGFFYVWWNDDKVIYRANVLIGSDEPNQKQRNHLIREEVTQSLGLINDSYKYSESIFYQEWSETQEFADIDKRLIEILYSDMIAPGMSRQEAMEVLMTVISLDNPD